MDKQISFSTQGTRSRVGHVSIARLLPNRYAQAVGPFVFLDHIPPFKQTQQSVEGIGAHPHRGIATLSYVLQGEDEHWDSAGHYAKVYSGGVQWMNAGNGVIHDENYNPDSQTQDGMIHGFQFWVNLPAAIKAQKPAYMAVQAPDVPKFELADQAGWLKVIVGAFGPLKAAIPTYTEQFLYHLHLEAGQAFEMDFPAGIELAAFLPSSPATLNGQTFQAGNFIEFDREAGRVQVQHNNTEALDLLIFGGEPYTEPIVAEGPFVMNSHAGIADAYRDYFAGKYGEIKR